MDKSKEAGNNSENKISTIQSKSKELTSIEKLLITVIRRKKLFFVTLISFLVFGFIRTTKEVIFNSKYEGGFTLLISDPINQVSDDLGGIGSTFFDIDSSYDQDIPTIRELLLSEAILKEISKKYNLSIGSLASRIRIVRKL